MRNQSTEEDIRPRVTWDTLEEWLRGCIQHAVQDLWEEEVSELLGQAASSSSLRSRAGLWRVMWPRRLTPALASWLGTSPD